MTGTIPTTAKPKRVRESQDVERANLVADVAVRTMTALAAMRPGATYDDLRVACVHAIYTRFATSYGIHVVPVDGSSEALDELPYSDLTPEHFGAAHEALSGFGLRDGAIVPTRERRAGGVHFTPRGMIESLVLNTLKPLLQDRGAVFRDIGLLRFRSAMAGAYDHDPDGPAGAAEALLAITITTPEPEAVLGIRVLDPAVGAGAFLLTALRILAAMLARAWDEHGGAPSAADRILAAKRLIANRSLFGIDISPFAVHATKLALSLECRVDALPTWSRIPHTPIGARAVP